MRINKWILSVWILAMQLFGGTLSAQINSKVKDEPYRPQIHFSPKEKWMNDPNGMLYYKGIYHLFFQYYPDSTVWGPMHWGHAISTDLFHWEQQPIALYPDSLGYIFSGSTVATGFWPAIFNGPQKNNNRNVKKYFILVSAYYFWRTLSNPVYSRLEIIPCD